MLDEPVRLAIRTYRTRPKAVKEDVIFAAVKPDYDNVGKLIGDCIEGTVLINDSRIAVATVEKYFAKRGEAPRVEITLSRLGNNPQDRRKKPVEDKIFELLDLEESMSLHDLAAKLGQKPKQMLNNIKVYKIPFELKEAVP